MQRSMLQVFHASVADSSRRHTRTTVFVVVAGDAPRVFRLIRTNGHLVKALDKDGRTALFEACVRGHVDVARVLVEAGADVSSSRRC